VTRPTALLAVLVLVTLGAVGCGIGCGSDGSVQARAAAPARVAAAPAGHREAEAVEVLRDWDVRRADAWSRGDEVALRALYVDRSTAGRRDVAMLRAWARRGLRVGVMRMQLLAAHVRVQTGDRIVLVVTDRLVGAVAVGRGVRVPLPLPRDAASTRTVTLRRVVGEWRVSAVRP
jgi:hypothetical protein